MKCCFSVLTFGSEDRKQDDLTHLNVSSLSSRSEEFIDLLTENELTNILINEDSSLVCR